MLHKCDNPPCCNPSHLFAGTPKDNVHDMLAKGRDKHNAPRGEKVWRAKLTERQVRLVKWLHRDGFARKEICELTGVDAQNCGKILGGYTWRWVK